MKRFLIRFFDHLSPHFKEFKWEKATEQRERDEKTFKNSLGSLMARPFKSKAWYPKKKEENLSKGCDCVTHTWAPPTSLTSLTATFLMFPPERGATVAGKRCRHLLNFDIFEKKGLKR